MNHHDRKIQALRKAISDGIVDPNEYKKKWALCDCAGTVIGTYTDVEKSNFGDVSSWRGYWNRLEG